MIEGLIIVIIMILLVNVFGLMAKAVFYIVNKWHFNIPKDLLFLGEDKAYINFVKKLYKQNHNIKNKKPELLDSLKTYKQILSNQIDKEDLQLLKVYVNIKSEEYRSFRGISFFSTLLVSFLAIFINTISIVKEIEFNKYLFFLIEFAIIYFIFVITVGVVQHIRRKNQFNLLKGMIELCEKEKSKKFDLIRSRVKRRTRT